MPKLWPQCRCQAPQPRIGAPKAQGLIAALRPQHNPPCPRSLPTAVPAAGNVSTGAAAFTAPQLQSRISTSLTDVTGVAVHAFNQRTVAEIFDMIRTLGALVGAAERADRLAAELAAEIAHARRCAAYLTRRPLVYFEEWDEPMISGIAWVSELIETAGGLDIFADRAGGKSARERIVTTREVIARQPEIMIGSWCGKKFRPEKVAARAGFDQIPAVRDGALYEIKSPIILQPGPAASTEGLTALEAVMARHA